MTKTPLWLDCDGVLLDWVRPFLDYIKSPVKYEDLTQYDLSCLFGGNTEVMVHSINQFNETAHYRYLKPLCSRGDLLRLKLKGYELNIISQVDGDEARQNRIQNIEDEFGKDIFNTILLTGRHEKKVDVLRKYEPYDDIKVVEDNPQFFKDAVASGHFTLYAIGHPYNIKELKEISTVPIYTGIPELVRHLTLE
jgi:hypothetical protein